MQAKKKPQILLHSVSCVYALICILPFLVVISASLTNDVALSRYGYGFWPAEFDAMAYRHIFKSPETVLRSYQVTLIITAASMCLGVLFMSMAAYPLARRNCAFRGGLSFYVFFTMLFSGGLVPTYILITQTLKMRNTLLVMILPGVVNAFHVFMIRTFFAKLPESLFEAAKMDGAGELRIYARIAMPLSIPVLATVAFFTAMAKWNDWYTALLYITEEELYPLQYLLYRIQQNILGLLKAMEIGTASVDPHDMPGQNLVMAMAVVAAGPMLIIFPLFQRYFVSGLTVGAVKG